MSLQDKDRWIFAYGSLMWRPNFEFEEIQTARLFGYHRSLCIFSPNYRGTPNAPGLVVGLDLGGSCVGRAYRVHPNKKVEIRAYLDEREVITGVYHRRDMTVSLETGLRVPAYGYVVKRDHELYTGRLKPDEAVKFVIGRKGRQGTCLEYIKNTVTHIEKLGFDDSDLRQVLDLALEK